LTIRAIRDFFVDGSFRQMSGEPADSVGQEKGKHGLVIDLHKRWVVAGICLFLAIITWLVFGQTLHHKFINYDDDVYVYRNPEVTSGLTLKGLFWAFTHIHSSNWHPVTWISHMLDCQIYGLNPDGHHFTNVLLHTSTAIFLFLVLREMTGFLWRSALVAAVFAVHPLRVESVAWVAERKDVLSGLFFMLTIGAYIRYVRHPQSFKRYFLVCLMFVLALLSKPTVVTLPFVLLLLDWWPLKRMNESSSYPALLQLIVEKIPLLALSCTTCMVTFFAQADAMSFLPLSARIANAIDSYVTYLGQMFYPVGLAVFYPYPEAGLASGRVVVDFILLLLITAVAVVARKKWPSLLMGWLWYVGMLVPVIGILQVGSQAHADRYTYLPQIGLYIGLTWAIADLCVGWRPRYVVLGSFSAATLVTLIFVAHVQASYWQNSESLWTHTLACTSDNVVAENNFGNTLLDNGNIDGAMVHFQKALQIIPNHAEAHYNLGNALFRKGDVNEAIVQYQDALQSKPNDEKTHYNLGVAFLQQGKVDEAISEFQTALHIIPDDVVVLNNLGNADFQHGSVDQAISNYQQALQINPNDAKIHYNLGVALAQKHDFDEAIAHFQKCLKIKPGDITVMNNLGNVLFLKGDINTAIGEFLNILQIKPDDANARYSLGFAFLQEGDLDGAIMNFQKTLRIKPNWAEAHYNLGNALIGKGNTEEAMVHYEKAIQIKPDYSDAQNNLAWSLATTPQASLRDGKKAVELARQANQVTRGQDLDILGTLAAAYAEAGRFNDAIQNAQKAIDLAKATGQQDQISQLNNELKLYESRLPFHEDSK
jgi:tetratricopeptide (TPR) repeat protein